ncbi:MAG: hypothetical protein ACI97A_000397 [Planctomycetota bacterium]|jgi:hypothetical protein
MVAQFHKDRNLELQEILEAIQNMLGYGSQFLFLRLPIMQSACGPRRKENPAEEDENQNRKKSYFQSISLLDDDLEKNPGRERLHAQDG